MKIKLVALALIIGAVSGCGSSSDGSSENVKTESVKTENASVCFNDALYQVGTKYTLRMKEGSDPVDIKSSEVMEVLQYRGQEAIRVDDIFDNDRTYKTNSYISVDSSNKSVTTLGYIDDNSGQKSEIYYTPGLETKFDLNAGESYEQTYTEIEHDPLNHYEAVYDSVVKFIGIETITVPAGTYKTCKFEEKATVTLASGLLKTYSVNKWYAVEHGVLVKAAEDTEAEAEAEVLVGASINGEEI